MHPSIERTVGPWAYEIRVTNLFKIREGTEPVESSSDLAGELHIMLELDIAELPRGTLCTEDLCISISSAPGQVERFETYFKERCDGSRVLEIVLRATPFTSCMKGRNRPLELPVYLRIKSNSVPFGDGEYECGLTPCVNRV